METATTKHKKVSFKIVHDDIFNESTFLEREHDTQGFKHKASFLKDMGFNNSIATKMYDELSSKASEIKNHNEKYKGTHKLILEPQLERICEKYDLYVRNPEFFCGDIPTKNVKALSEFWVYLSDIVNILSVYKSEAREMSDAHERIKMRSPSYHSEMDNKMRRPTDVFPFVHTDTFCKLQRINPDYTERDVYRYDPKIKITQLNAVCEAVGINNNFIEIAAIKELFIETAFKKSNARIINTPELEATGVVDTDPIVLFKTPLGRIIMTAWGDESNDELVSNQILN